jgi:hypothetical protein
MELIRKHWIKLAIGAGAAACAYAYFAGRADAADLGGNCCSDLEERIAELEATTARKGNRKVSLSVVGVVNKSLFHYDVDGVDFKDTVVIENGSDETRVGFIGKAQVSKDWAVGYVLEIGQGKSGVEIDFTPPGSIGIGTDNDIYTRQSYAFVDSPFGKVSLGLLSMQTDDFTVPSVANTTAATKRLTLAPVSGLIVTIGPLSGNIEIDPFDGKKADALRYDTPIMGGFSAGVAWESASDSYDAALRYAGELGGFLVLASVGYEVDKRDDLLSFFGVTETKTTLANGGIKHIASGIFVQGSWAHLEVDPVGVETDVWHGQAGIEGKWFAVGPTTVWGGVAQWDDADLTTYELGINQNLNAAVDAYVVGKTYEIDDVDAKSLLGGIRLKF